jgi:hypothetical protein
LALSLGCRHRPIYLALFLFFPLDEQCLDLLLIQPFAFSIELASEHPICSARLLHDHYTRCVSLLMFQ